MTLAKWTDDLGDFGDYWTIVPGDSHPLSTSGDLLIKLTLPRSPSCTS